MKLIDHVPNSNGKFEFHLDDSLGKTIETNSTFAYQFAKKKFNTFRNTFGIENEPCVFEASLDTYIAILAGILEEYETKNPKNNILNWKYKNK